MMCAVLCSFFPDQILALARNLYAIDAALKMGKKELFCGARVFAASRGVSPSKEVAKTAKAWVSDFVKCIGLECGVDCFSFVIVAFSMCYSCCCRTP